MSAPKQSCLFALSAANEGVNAQSFVQAYNLVSPQFLVQLSSPHGKKIEFVQQEDSNRRWFNEFLAKTNSNPISFTTVDPLRYGALIIPDSPGALHDLHHDNDLKQIIEHFIKEKKPICAIGTGVAGLFCAKNDSIWGFEDFSLTTVSLNELARNSDFPNLPVLPEDFVKDNLGKYTCSGEPDAVHVVIDRHVITGQNVHSTITAVQNLILMCTQKTSGRLSPRV